MPEFHSEPYLYLAAVTHKAALIAWGGFYFRIKQNEADWKLVDDSDLDYIHPPRRQTIGATSESYGPARVEVFDAAGKLVNFAETATVNHAWITSLQPDTEYTYRVLVRGEEWAAGERRDWFVDPDKQGLLRSGRSYTNRFRTQPAPETKADLNFIVIGDFGVGIGKKSTTKKRQREVALALEKVADQHDVRLILTTGDNIYAGVDVLQIPLGDTGDEDDDWFFTYYQPYRYLLNRIPVYPSVGNHDSGEMEVNDDRIQLADNFFLHERFDGEVTSGRASIGPGLFYRFKWGSEIEFICLDTSRNALLFGKRFFDHPDHAAFLQNAFAAPLADSPKWRIPFSHHPPYCAGPQHHNTKSMIESLVPLFRRAGVKIHLSGHEHNFQHSFADGIHFLLSGAAGKIRPGTPQNFAEAHTVSWAAIPHFLLCQIKGDELTITPIGEEGKPIERVTPEGRLVYEPIMIKA